MISFTNVLITVVSLLLLAVPGFIFAKIKMFKQGASDAFSVMVLYGCQPVMMFVSFQSKEFNPDLGLNMLYVFLLAVAVHLIMFGIMFLVFRKHQSQEKVRIIKYAGAFSNCGFMGLPFLQSLFAGNPDLQSEVLIYGAIVIAVFNVFNWTVGVYIMTGDIKQVSFKKIALNPVIIALILGFILFVTVKKPIVSLAEEGTTLNLILEKFMQTLNIISNTVTPLSLTVIGMKLASVNFKSLFLDKGAYLSTGLKIILMPLIAIFLSAFLPVPNTVKYAIFFLLSMPSATSSALFAVRFNKDADFASVCVMLSTILCAITIPLLFAFMNGALGVPLS